MGFKNEKFVKPKSYSGPTRYLYVSVGAVVDENLKTLLIEEFSKFGKLDFTSVESPIEIPSNRRYFFVIFKSVESAISASKYFETHDTLSMSSTWTKVFVRFAVPNGPRGPPEAECISTTEAVVVPGCDVIIDFISEEEEQILLNEIDHGTVAWKESISRRVQHYGFSFNYRTLMLDYSKATPAIPELFSSYGKKMHEFISLQTKNERNDSDSVAEFNQLTINEYFPGQGIASHIDTVSCFGPDMAILSLGSGIVMSLTKSVKGEDREKVREKGGGAEGSDAANAQSDTDYIPSSSANEEEGEDGDSSDEQEEADAAAKPAAAESATVAAESGKGLLRKYAYLPARSMLVLRGAARYEWAHGISPRKYDKINGVLQPRSRRVSLTFRQALKPSGIPSEHLQSTELELDHVVKVYDNIALHWNHTRGKRKVYWHRVKGFLDALPLGTLLADVGSGDGKYFGVNPNIVSMGCDRSIKLLEVSREPHHETFCCDAVTLPFRSNAFDATLCIAVLHHLSSVDRRYAVISELVRITRPGGRVMLQAWAYEQGKESKHAFQSQDTMVPWKLNKRFFTEQQSAATTATAGDNASSAAESVAEPAEKEDGQQQQADASNSGGCGSYNIDCKHVQEVGEDLVFQRYCHVYKEGELEDLCCSVPQCEVVESGWDKGNWFVVLLKTEEDRRLHSAVNGPASSIPGLVPRNALNKS